MESGGKIFTASLKDKFGDHGEILTLVIDEQEKALFFVMSCRVFQRNVEYAFLVWCLKRYTGKNLKLDFHSTERNEPFRIFLEGGGFARDGDEVTLNVDKFLDLHDKKLGLFTIIEGD